MNLEQDKPLDTLSDQELVKQYRLGRDDAFSTLLKRYQQELYHFLIRFVGNRVSAEDIFQDTFLQLHLSIDSFDTDRPFKPWLFTISANKARDYLRRNHQKQSTRLMATVEDAEDEGRAYMDLMDAGLPMPHDQAEQEETKALVQQAIASLPPAMREILILAYFHQFPYKDIAKMLDIPLGTVKSRLHAAVAMFAKEWKQHFHPQE